MKNNLCHPQNQQFPLSTMMANIHLGLLFHDVNIASSQYGASLGGPLCDAYNPTLRLFSRTCLHSTSDDDQTRPKHTKQRPNKHHRHSGGATNPSAWLAMLPTCWQHVGPTAKCRHFWPTRPSHADTKLIPTQHFHVGDGQHLPLSSFCCTHNLPKTSTYSLVYNTIEQLTTTTHNNQQEPRRLTLHWL